MSKIWSSDLATLTLLINLVQHTMPIWKFYVKSSSGSTVLCLVIPTGIRCTFVRLVYIRLPMSPS